MEVVTSRFSFYEKAAVAALLAAASAWLFPYWIESACGGLFALGWLVGLIAAAPSVRRPRLDVAVALAMAAVFVVALAYDPGPLAWTMFWCALSMAALLPRRAGFDDAWRWTIRLIVHGVTGIAKPLIDLAHLLTIKPRGRRHGVASMVRLLALPVIGTATFAVLFASANPAIAVFFGRIEFRSIGKIAAWIFATILVWSALRPHAIVTRLRIPEPSVGLPGTSLPSVLIALSLFNALFALHNGLDIAFMWSGAPLPVGMSVTEYVHRGTYPLIATALFAGLLVLTMLRPGAPSAVHRWVRRLVGLWVAQNILLVVSSALRTLNYIQDYGLTEWRIAALLWMALVATGLILICWRIRYGRSARWLINANAIAAALVLTACCFVDFRATAVEWNVRHAREVGGRAASLDLKYLTRSGSAALAPILQINDQAFPPAIIIELHNLRNQEVSNLIRSQSRLGTWTAHNAMRLAKARVLSDPANILRKSGA